MRARWRQPPLPRRNGCSRKAATRTARTAPTSSATPASRWTCWGTRAGPRPGRRSSGQADSGNAWLALWGALGLIKLGHQAPPNALERAAADARARFALYHGLLELDALDAFPPRHLNQASLAESEMVQWLLFPTELGDVPEAIELIGTAELDLDAGPADLYVFRFRAASGEPWLVGWSGPFLHADQPTTDGGWTFSSFEPEGEGPPEETVREIVDALMDDAD